MKIGDMIVLTEAAVVFDSLGHNLLLANTQGTITGIKGKLLSLQTSKGESYDNIPKRCAKLMTEGKAA